MAALRLLFALLYLPVVFLLVEALRRVGDACCWLDRRMQRLHDRICAHGLSFIARREVDLKTIKERTHARNS